MDRSLGTLCPKSQPLPSTSLDVKCDACPRNDVPLSMLYDNITPGNDLHSFQLIRKVMGDDSPTFHRIPPLSPVRSALDLGCGYGHWVSYAAQVWGAHGTKITGVYTPEEERTTPPLQDTENIKMLCHNFITEPLPLLDNSFDYVRLNDSLAAIPGERWDFVLSEVHRILSPGGRFELIHDQLYFSSINPETPVSCTFTPSRNSRDSYFDAGVCVSPKRDRTTQPDSKEALGDWEAEMNNCDDIERLYLDMLAQMYGVDTEPGPILADIIQRRFGGESQIKISNAQVCLPSQHTMTPTPVGTPKKPKPSKREFGISITIDWGQQNQDKCRKAISKVPAAPPPSPLELLQLDCLSLTSLPPVMSEKAAKLMGLRRTSSAAAAASKPYQPPGVVVVVHTSADGARRPMTFHPMSATELDMHASKHIHSVLSAKLALEAHVDGLLEQGLPAMSREALEDNLWQYAMFRRKRFNWPEIDPFVEWEPESDGDAELAEQMGRVTLSDTQSTDGLTPIRWFEIFEVTKSLE
ncbi:hypothetical protein BC827DRAFT_271409 [Russula dissimulans]|nr:hypothetical protein BC827DRAFT_271409 [Russula dissimulans]